MISTLGILAFSLIGLGLCLHIWLTKRNNKKLVCLIGDKHCDVVVHGDYSNSFGLPNEFLGIIYYGLLLLAYGIFLIDPLLKTDGIDTTMLIIIALAATFSIYLLAIQVFKLKTTCEWCIASGMISVAIFLFSL